MIKVVRHILQVNWLDSENGEVSESQENVRYIKRIMWTERSDLSRLQVHEAQMHVHAHVSNDS